MFKVLVFSVIVSLFILQAYAQGITNPTQAQIDANDNKALAFALTLENLELALFTQFQAQYGPSAFQTAGYAPTVYDNFNLILMQEQTHVATLNSVLAQRGGIPGMNISACTYNFSAVQSVSNYVALARLFTNVGTGAYDGNIANVYNKTIQQAAATIATVEARHAAFVNQLAGTISLPSFVPNPLSPFPNATDYALTPTSVSNLITPFLVSCPYNVASVLPSTIIVTPVAAPNASFSANPSQGQLNDNDILALNYALTLEILEATFYNRYLSLSNFSSTAFVAAGYTNDDYNYLIMIQAHENIHVAFLQQTITRLGGTPVVNCTYDFSAYVANVSTFLGLAKTLENAGVGAYDGAVNTITDAGLRVAAATVATIEARHASFLNQLVNTTSPFPSAFDNTTTPTDTFNLVNSLFIKNSCPYTFVAPQVLPVVPYSNSSASTAGLTSSTGTGSTGTGTSSSTTTHKTSSANASAVLSLFALVSALLLALL